MNSAYDRRGDNDGETLPTAHRAAGTKSTDKEPRIEALATPESEALALTKSRYPSEANSGRKAQVLQTLQRSCGNARVQRMIAQNQVGAAADEYPINRETSQQIEAARGSGRALETETRVEMETAFGQSFADVRVHTGSEADHLAQAVKAEAFTVDRDVFFREGRYSPGSPHGQGLIAHELGHVASQGRGSPREAGQVSQTVEPLDGARSDVVPSRSAERARETAAWTGVYAVHRKPAGGAEPTVAALEEQLKGLNTKTNCILALLDFESDLSTAIAKWRTAFRNLGSSYANAYDNHRRTIEKQAKYTALGWSFAFGVLNVVLVGALGGVGDVWVKSDILAKSIDTNRVIWGARLEDGLQAAMGKVIDIPSGYFTPSPDAISENPQVFQNSLLNALDNQWIKSQDYVRKVRGWLQQAKPDAFTETDVDYLKSKLQESLTENKYYAAAPLEPDLAEMERDMERLIWAKWSMANLVSVRVEASTVGEEAERRAVPGLRPVGISTMTRVTEYSSPGSKIEARLVELGIPRMAGIGEDFGWWTSDAEVERLLSWASDFSSQVLGRYRV